ncbi:hypothetical protein LguiB_030977 [Lonicera macranthoides]
MGMYRTDSESQEDHPRKKSICNKCCAWGSLAVCIVLLLILLAGVIFFAFLQGNLPEIRIQRLDVRRLNVSNTKSSTLLTAIFELRMNATNKNSKIGLSYSKLIVDVVSEDVSVGRTEVPPFYQQPHSMHVFKVTTGVSKSQVTWYDAKDLKDNSKRHLMVIDAVFKGKLTFVINGNKVNTFPFKVACQDIDQSEIDAGHAPKCDVKISLFS